jgi:hypothetical protein
MHANDKAVTNLSRSNEIFRRGEKITQVEKSSRIYDQHLKSITRCDHSVAEGTFIYKGEGPGAIRQYFVCGYMEKYYCPDLIKNLVYVQWKTASSVKVGKSIT